MSTGFTPDIRLLPDVMKPTSTVAETFPRWVGATNTATGITTQLLGLQAIYLNLNQIATNLVYTSATTAAVAPTNWWFALYDSSLNLIRQSTDQLTAAWAGNTAKTLALDSIPATAGARVASAVVTLTIPTLNQSLASLCAAGDSIVVSNANVAAYNGTFTVDSVTSTTIVYTCGGSSTDSLVAPFPTVKLAASKKVYTVAATGLYYAGFLMKAGTMITMFCNSGSSQFSVVTGLATILAASSTTSLTGTAPSPAAALTALGAFPYVYIT